MKKYVCVSDAIMYHLWKFKFYSDDGILIHAVQG